MRLRLGPTRLRLAFLGMLIAILSHHQASAWGTAGHSVVAEIAQRRLSPDVLRQVKDLLGGEVSLASEAAWADDVALARPETIRWHFVNIPYAATGYDPDRDCQETPKGDCVIKAIARFRTVLADRSMPKASRAEALRFLVHLIGDIHQPLHDIDRNDAGGSQLPVLFYDRPMSLHAAWDFGLIEKHTFDWGDYVRQIEQLWLPGQDVVALQRGEPVDWAWDAHMAAVKVSYVLPEDLRLGDDYFRRGLPVVTQQLALAGIRLARVLNEALGAPQP
jgi:S1/P1 Nuclease